MTHRALYLALRLSIASFASTVAAQDVDLGNLGERGFRIDGVAAEDRSGRSVSGAGDVNGDGLADVIIGAYRADAGGDVDAGASYVVFGKRGSTTVDLANLGANGFRIDGIDAVDELGRSVSGAGDINGDGLADLLIGAPSADPGGDDGAGESYVVFGKADGAPVDLANLGAGGFRIDGVDAGDRSGNSVSGAGDINGDGLDDLIIGANNATANGASNAGRSYVVFGKTGTARVNLASLGSGGFRIDGIDGGDRAANSVSGAGDVNGDGLADVIIGAFLADPDGIDEAGESYVVFGKADNTTVNLASLGARGFRIDGIDDRDRSGISVSGAGDVNGDGLTDLIVGAYVADPDGRTSAGESYVVFGKADTSTVTLASLGTGGFRIDGSSSGDFSGANLAGAGDVNGDGLADLIIGARNGDPGGQSQAGESVVVFGKADSTPVDMANLGARGFRIAGINANDESGRSVSGAGDVNGDGLADVIIGAHLADPDGKANAGESYVVFSAAVAPLSATVRARSANGNPPRTAFGISGSGNNHSTPDARAFVDFANGSDAAASASTETMTLTRSAGSFPEAAADVSWALQTTRQNWTTAELRLRYLDRELLSADEGFLQIVFSADGAAPFTPLPSIVSAADNSITATITQAGVYFIGVEGLEIFADGFE